MPHTYVLGLGNVLMGDDGFGPAAVRALAAQYDVGAEAEVVDLGTPGLDLTPWFVDAAHVIIIDTVKASLPPGSITLYDKVALTTHAPVARVSPHDPGVKETILTLEFAGRAPERVTLVGVVPDHVGMALALTPALDRAVAPAVEQVAALLRADGIAVTPRRASRDGVSAPWWQVSADPASAALRPTHR